MHIINGEKVQRGRHLGIQDVKQHRFQHQNEGHKHLITPGFIQPERFAEEEDNHHDG